MKKRIGIIIIILLLPYLIGHFLVNRPKTEYYLITNNIDVRVKRTATNQIESIPIETYIVGVLAGEMPVSFHLEALKAQAVAARTYVSKRIVANFNNDYDVVDSVLNQVYLDDAYLKERWQDEYQTKFNKLQKAVTATKGEILVYKGQIVEALYFSTSNGYTENSEDVFDFALPYLKSVASHWDEETSLAFSSKQTITLKQFYHKLNLAYQAQLKIENIKRSATGRIIELTINNKKFKGTQVREKLAIKSTDFTITQDNNTLYISAKGYGHGVGMSQYGANGMALDGYNYKEILSYYYKDVSLKKI